MQTRTMEIGVGVFVVIGLAALLMLAMKVANLAELSDEGGYRVEARFDNVGGLKVRSAVTMAGVRIGRVTGIAFDEHDYRAVVTLSIRPEYDRIPADSSASILTAGLLGEQYVGLEPGAEETYLREGGAITLTQSAIVLENVVGQFLYNRAAQGPGGQ